MYKVISIIMDGLTIKGYRIEDIDTGKTLNIKDDKMIEFIRSGKIKDASIIEDEGHEFIDGLKLSQLMITSGKKIRLAEKIYGDNGKVIGYQVAESEKNITANKAWNMAVNGEVENGEASFSVNGNGEIKKYFQLDE